MINYDLFKEIEHYAKRHVESSLEHYKSRNQNQETMFINCLRGKIAEWECFFSMKKEGYILKEKPDMLIYSGSNKSYDADLVCIGKNNSIYEIARHIHVKSISQETNQRIGASFLVQKNDPLVIHPKDNHYYSVLLQQSLTQYTFHTWLKSTETTYSEPKAKHLAKTKLAVYL